MKKFSLILLTIILNTQVSKGQILISLLLGDKLNSGKLEFGLEGGLVTSNINNMPDAKAKLGFDLGFYFDFKLKKNLFLHTGVLVKSPMGVRSVPPYPTGNVGLDSLVVDGKVKRRLSYFHVPVLLKYKFDNQLSFEAGPQFGLLNKATDDFTTEIKDKNDLIFKNNIKSSLNKIDIGASVGVGYKLLKGTGMNLGVRYYFGFLNIIKDNPGDAQKNSALYVYAGIPIGVKKKPTE